MHRGIPYSEKLRSFATTLNFYSAKAYRYVRQAFNNALPHEKTVARWYRGVDGEPGVTAEALTVLESKSKDFGKAGRQLMVSLSMDEMAIRHQIEWNPYKKKFDGVVDYGEALSFLCDSNRLMAAKEALVFMASSVEEDWKIPVAYFLTAGLKTNEKKEIVEGVMVALEDAGVKVIGLTFDGTATNFAVANAFGCNLKENGKPLVTHFPHPSGDHPVHVILDACHMLKLVRNVLSSQSVLTTAQGEVRWSFLEQLNDMQNQSGLQLAPHLSNHHINFQNQKMKVILAAQTLSKSVSDALKSLENHPDFEGSMPTAEFVSVFNNLFDVLNSMDPSADGLKKPMAADNYTKVEEAFSNAIGLIRSIRLTSGQPVLQSQYKTGFLGFLIDIQSFSEMYKELVKEQGELQMIRAYRFSQDHVETFFAAVRAKGGSNNNPNVAQFKAAYKRLLTHNSVTAPDKANCFDFVETSILSVSCKSCEEASPETSSSGKHMDDTQPSVKEVLDVLSTEDCDMLSCDNTDNSAENLDYSVSTKTIGFIRKELARTVKCSECVNIVRLHDSFSNFVQTVYDVSEQQFKVLIDGLNNVNVGKLYELLEKTIVQKLLNSYIWIDFENHTFENDDIANDHKISFIKFSIAIVLNMRLSRYAKSIQPFKQSTRNKYTKLILFEGH